MKWTAAAMAVVVVALGAGTASAATPIEVVRQVMTGAPGRMPDTLRCVTRRELLALDGHPGTRTRGVSIWRDRTRTVLLDWKDVCRPLHRFRTGRRVEPAQAIQALLVVLHEKAHVNGIRVEWQAECAAIPGVLRQLKRWGYSGRQLSAVRRYLTVELDKGRTSEYKLRGRCRA